jgi:VWFA-related protein
LIDEIPEVSGGTPLYDMIVLAYAQELRNLPLERNALIVISDGVDNRVYGTGTASEVPFKDLRRAAEAMEALIYPIFLDQFTAVPPPGWAKKAKENMQELADVTGGRLFVASSVRDLDPVYPQVAEELRSVYTLAYYPSNQEFDGSWRNVEVRVKRPGARVRTRSGYFAK